MKEVKTFDELTRFIVYPEHEAIQTIDKEEIKQEIIKLIKLLESERWMIELMEEWKEFKYKDNSIFMDNHSMRFILKYYFNITDKELI